MGKVLNVLVLAGTADARFVIESLSDSDNLSMIASLAGATDAPLPLPVKVRTGGFGGPDGMAEYCSEHAIDVILDITHPFARQISHNAEIAADMVGLPCLAFDRPPWVVGKGGREFDSWQEMVDALTPGEHVFLAGGTASVEVFSKRADVFLCARALNVMNDDSIANRVFINAMPNAAVEEEVALFKRHGITLLCCKNSGGDASRAKLDAANILEIPVWMLARHKRKTGMRHQRTFDTLGALISAVRQMSVSKYGHSG